MAENRRDGSVDRERDLVLLRELTEASGPFQLGLHPEATLEVDLAGGVAALEEKVDRGLRAFPAGHARWAEAGFHDVRRQEYGLGHGEATDANRAARAGDRTPPIPPP